MAKTNRPATRRSARRPGGGAVKLLLGVAIGMLLTATGIVGYFYFGKPPAAATEKAALWEPLLAVPVQHRAKAWSKPAPFTSSEEVFETGARTYHAHCFQCHGAPGNNAALGRAMLPHAQQFFSATEREAVTGQTPGEIYWETAFGIRRSGMPAYSHSLSDTQLWQLALLLHSAGDLPGPVRAILTANAAPQPSVVLP